jgi:hypothetical protein
MEGSRNYENTLKTPEEIEALKYAKNEKYAQDKDDKELAEIEAEKLRALDEKQRQRSMGQQLEIPIK